MKVLFVCLGNICRSPTAQGVFEKLLADEWPDAGIEVDSAGTHAYHKGEPPDRRAQRAAAERDIDLSSQRARPVTDEDFLIYDYIVAMDRDNYAVLESRKPEEFAGRLCLFMEFAPDLGREDVPDPYYGGLNGFEHVLDLVTDAAKGLLRHIKSTR